MMKIKDFLKRTLTLLLAFSILTLCSCTLITETITATILADRGYYTEYGMNGKCDDRYDSASEEQVLSLLSQMEELVKKNDPKEAKTLLSLYDQFESTLYAVLDHTNLVYIRFCQQPKDQKASDEYNRLSAFGTDAIARLYLLYGKIHESALSDTFYEEWSEDSINEALYLSKTYSGQFADVTKQRDELVTLYEQLDRDSLKFSSKSADYYHQIVAKNKILAGLAGYDNYPSYAAERIYERDYGEEQVEDFMCYVKEYIVPLAEDLRNFVKSDVSSSSITELSVLMQYDISFSLMEEKLTPYYQLLGNDFSDGFSSFTESVFTADDKKSSPVAFTTYQQNENQPICYFGPGYQTVSTYVHEQGHYLAFYFSECSLSAVDLCETHSQSNEWLYLAYSGQSYTEEMYREITAYYLLNSLVSMLLACCCDSFERAVYADDSLQADDYDDLFLNCAKELGAYDFLKSYLGSNLKTYWHHAVISNSMYYLSYAVSLIPSIEFFLIANEDGFDEASDIYRDLCTVDQDAAFLETVISSSLSSPFEEEIFKKISIGFKIS